MGITIIWLLWIVVLASDAGVGVVHLYSLIYGGLAIGIVWLVMLFVMWRSSKPNATPWPARVRWMLATPALLLLGSISEFVPQPSLLFKLRFRLSQEALEREAKRTLDDGERVVLFGRRVGLFAVHNLSMYDGQVRFITTNCGIVDACGVVYSPNAPPTRVSEDQFVHLRGPWWHVYQGF